MKDIKRCKVPKEVRKIVYCPECGKILKDPETRERWDNSMSCENGHKFDVFIVAGHITIHSSR